MLLNGILPAVTTPFYPDGRIYFKKLEHNIGRYSRTPVTGMVVLGSTGEVVMLNDDEKRDVLRAAADAAAPEKVLIAGVGHDSAIETVRMSEFAAKAGYDLAMVRTPNYYRAQMSPAAMLAYYRFVADRSPLPVILYNIPQATGYDLSTELTVELASHPNIVGLKESSGNVAKVKEIVDGTRHVRRQTTVTHEFQAVTGRMIQRATAAPVGEFVSATALAATAGGQSKPSSSAIEMIGDLKTRKKEVGFQVLVGTAHKLLDLLEAGATGAILAFADCAPTACYEIYAAWKDGDRKLAEEKQQRITAASSRIVAELGIPALKYAMDLNAYYGGPARLPLLPITADVRNEVDQLMAEIKS